VCPVPTILCWSVHFMVTVSYLHVAELLSNQKISHDTIAAK
jgi:hypothetical protein